MTNAELVERVARAICLTEEPDGLGEWKGYLEHARAAISTIYEALQEPDGETEWHKSDGQGSVLLYTLRQDGWRKGEPRMVNDVTVRVDQAHGSTTPLEPIVSRILSALTASPLNGGK